MPQRKPQMDIANSTAPKPQDVEQKPNLEALAI